MAHIDITQIWSLLTFIKTENELLHLDVYKSMA